MMGLWVASTAHKDIVFYYHMYLLPALTSLLLAAAGISFSRLAATNRDVWLKFDTLVLPTSGYGSKADDVEVTVGLVSTALNSLSLYLPLSSSFCEVLVSYIFSQR